MGQVLELVNVGRFGFINVCRNRRYDAGRTICRQAIKKRFWRDLGEAGRAIQCVPQPCCLKKERECHPTVRAPMKRGCPLPRKEAPVF